MIEFLEDESSSYSPRTWRNSGEADATIAVAIDFDTAGEKLTKKAAITQGKLFAQVKIDLNSTLFKNISPELQGFIDEFKFKGYSSLNVAGNGIYTFNKYGISQRTIDVVIFNLITFMISFGCDIRTIRSGGQTGVDESGLKVGDYLGMRTICLAPKGWRFRTEDGDIYDEELFKRRFKRNPGEL